MLLTTCNHEFERLSVRIDDRVNAKEFAGTIRGSTCVLTGADYRAVDHMHLGIVPVLGGSQDTSPNDYATPTQDAIVADCVEVAAFGHRCSFVNKYTPQSFSRPGQRPILGFFTGKHI